jgi:hypothetical protein
MIDTLKTMRAELAEAVELMRPHFPEDGEQDLLARAEHWRMDRYQTSSWPDWAVVAKINRNTGTATVAQYYAVISTKSDLAASESLETDNDQQTAA